jgi:hypothetical protein
MTSGGARARSGPPADPRSGRSERRKDGWTELPAKSGIRAPAWPLVKQTAAEKTLWAKLWKKPQAVAWKKLGLDLQVAAYVRSFLESTEQGAPASLKTTVLRQEDTLGLSTVGMNALRWRIVEDELATKRSSGPRAVEAAPEERAAPVRRLRPAAASA